MPPGGMATPYALLKAIAPLLQRPANGLPAADAALIASGIGSGNQVALLSVNQVESIRLLCRHADRRDSDSY